MQKKIYYESDFAVAVTLPDGVGDSDFTLDAYTDGYRVIRFSRADGKLSSNLMRDDKGRLLAIFRDHGLRVGKLIAEFSFIRDGLRQVAKWHPNIELSPITTEASVIPTLDLVGYITQGGSGDNGGEDDSIQQRPIDFAPQVSPVGNITVDQMDVTTIRVNAPIASYDLSNVRYIKSFGNVWFDTMGEATLSEDKRTLTLTWNIVKGNYPSGTSLTLEIPAGCIVTDDGSKNLEYKANVNIV